MSLMRAEDTCLLDEVVEVGVPAVVEVAEEQQAAAVVDERPMCEVDGSHAAEVAVRRLHSQQQI